MSEVSGRRELNLLMLAMGWTALFLFVLYLPLVLAFIEYFVLGNRTRYVDETLFWLGIHEHLGIIYDPVVRLLRGF